MKNRLDEIKSLMRRMEEVPNGGSNFLMESSIGRLDFNGNIEEFFNTIDIGKGFWVSLGYIQNYDLTKIYPDKNRMSFNNEFSKIDKGSRLYGKMNKFMNSSEFLSPTGRKYAGLNSMKSHDFNSVLLTASYTFNWGDIVSLAKSYQARNEEEMQIRKKYGFGKDESEYPEDDWRRNPNYGGLGLMPQKEPKRKNPDGSEVKSPYTNKANTEINLFRDNDTYGNDRMSTRKDGTEYQKHAFKFSLNDVKKQWKTYYLIDNNGEIDGVENNLAYLFSKPTASKKADLESIINNDEKEFAKEMNEYIKKCDMSTKIWLLDNIAYIVGTGYDKQTGELLQGARWTNPNIIEMFPDSIKRDELDTIISNAIAKSRRDVDEEFRKKLKEDYK